MKLLKPFLMPCLICMACLAVGFVIGYAYLPEERFDAAAFRAEMAARLEQPGAAILGRVLRANTLAFLTLAAGSITAGLASSIHIALIGVLLGRDAFRTMRAGFSANEFLLFIAPHGVLELLGFILVGSIGIRIFVPFIGYLRTGKFLDREDWRGIFLVASVGFLLIFAAAFAEAFITPAVVAHSFK